MLFRDVLASFFAYILSPKLETNLLIKTFAYIREYSTVGSAYLMTDPTDRLASTVINLVLPDKVFCNGMPKGLGNILSFAVCRGKKN